MNIFIIKCKSKISIYGLNTMTGGRVLRPKISYKKIHNFVLLMVMGYLI